MLAYPDTPREFKEGLLRIALDEVRHMNLYAAQIERLGHHVGDFPVRDWFWERVPLCKEPVSFVAVMGLGLEEIAHVRFGAKWFAHFHGGLEFAAWSASLPPPLSPMLMRGKPLARAARKRAGQSDAFLDELEAWQPRGS